MKKITFIRFLAFLILLFSTTIGFSQTIIANLTPSNSPLCSPTGCQANDVEIGEVYIADANGTRLTTCNTGEPIAGQYLWVQITKASSKYALYMQFNMYRGADEIDQNGNIISDGTTNKITVGDNRQISVGNYRMMPLPSYTCGNFLTLKDIYLAWQTPGGSSTPGCATQQSKCAAENLPNTIIVNTPLAVNFTSNISCTGGTFEQVIFTNSSTGGNGTLAYLWNFGTGASPATANTAGPHTVTYTSGGSKTVSLKVTDIDTDTDTETKIITVESCCTTPIIANKTATICSGSIFNVSPTNGGSEVVPTGTTYTWTAPIVTGITGTTAGTNATNISGTLTNSTNAPINVLYSVTPKSGTCTGNSFNVTVTVNPNFTLAASSKTDAACYLASTGSVTAGAVTNAVGTVTYSWKNASNIEVGTSENVSNLPAGTYTLTVTDNCFSKTNSVTISQPAALVATIGTPTNVSCFGGNNGAATASATGGTTSYSYSWNTSPVQTTAT
ncbi:PKD-like domain-containing protein, partial [Flavobacterium sp. LB3P21]|uniref:PKD-like domain-containing protein n=1 Tax=Flavobacterium sp. LB3P21 TaxID=3401719 RepID=UPI003AAD1545